MISKIITRERFHSIINSIPQDADGVGFRLKEVYYSYARQKSGTYKGKPYTKPEHILINAKQKRFWIERIDQKLHFLHDPTGGFNPIPLTEPDDLQELERYFTKLENHLQIIGGKQPAADSTKPAADSKGLEVFIQTILDWCDQNQQAKVRRAAELALAAPKKYLEANKEPLALRGIHKPIRRLYLFALVDTMQKIGIAAEVDWKADYEIIFGSVSRLAGNLGINLQPVRDPSNLQTHQILQSLGKDLATQDHVLATIDIDSDSYVLLVLPAASSSKSIELAKKLGIKLDKF